MSGTKGRKDRVVYAAGGASDALDTWLLRRGDEAGPLFHPVNKADRIQRRRISDQVIYDALKRLGRGGGAKAFSPHDIRRIFIGDLLDAGADISAAQ